MSSQSYRLNLEFRDGVHADIRRPVMEYTTGSIGVIAVSRTLSPLQHIVEKDWPDLATLLLVFGVIVSETDALPIGRLREM